mmetsp:Transcript_28082/g.61304  ORF Transcript_28082/g.61304 Transcript_28082/m.61304 type:complete len:648 (-) Transcript_28082:167-2110(-)
MGRPPIELVPPLVVEGAAPRSPRTTVQQTVVQEVLAASVNVERDAEDDHDACASSSSSFIGLSAEAPAPVGTAASPQDVHATLRRLWKSEELIKELRKVVRAQHAKIEELREQVDEPAAQTFRSTMSHVEVKDLSTTKRENEELRRTVNQMKVEGAKLKSEAATLRKVNQRLKAMLEQLPHRESPKDQDSAEATNANEETLLPTAAWQGETTASFSKVDEKTATFSSHGLSPARAPRFGFTTKQDSGTLPPFSKLSLLLSVIPLFWREEVASPAEVMQALVDIANRVLSDRPCVTVTVYMIDPWLRKTTTSADVGQPTVYYLGQGSTQLQVLPQEGVRPEPPRFPDVTGLPVRTRSCVAVALQIPLPGRDRTLGVLQAVSVEAPQVRKSRSPSRGPKVLRGVLGSSTAKEPRGSSGFGDSHLLCLQLACNVASGLLQQLERLEYKSRVLHKMSGCVEAVVAMNKCRSLPDFEQRVKHLFGMLFSVNLVRVLFFDEETGNLLISSVQVAQPKRKQVVEIELDKGIVGLCAKRRQIVHIANISQHPYVDMFADGLNRSGRPVNPQASMLCGPLVVDYDEGSRLVGVIQLLERSRKVADASAWGEFSPEEQRMFEQLLRVCAHVVWRTFQVQELSAKLEGSSRSLPRMLA